MGWYFISKSSEKALDWVQTVGRALCMRCPSLCRLYDLDWALCVLQVRPAHALPMPSACWCRACMLALALGMPCMFVCVRAKVSIAIMLKLRGSTILHPYYYCKP